MTRWGERNFNRGDGPGALVALPFALGLPADGAQIAGGGLQPTTQPRIVWVERKVLFVDMSRHRFLWIVPRCKVLLA
jgi:hypothetical protein